MASLSDALSGGGEPPVGRGEGEVEFQRLTILTFLQSSVVQSMALSHRDFPPVTQYEGLQVHIAHCTVD